MPEKRLNCRIPLSADTELNRIIARRKSKKGKTIAFLLEQARDNPDHPIRTFNGNEAETSTYNAPEKWLSSFDAYRERYGLYENTTFFRHALIRGISIALDGHDANDNGETS